MNDGGAQRQMNVPYHIQEAIDEIVGLRAQVCRDTSLSQRAVERLTKRLGQPFVVTTIIGLVAAWIVMNLTLKASGHPPFHPYPFSALQGVVSFCALVTTVLILTSETRVAEVNERRARLNVQMSIVVEQKVAKVIELLEQHRRHDPNQPDRLDPEAKAMTEPVSPGAVLRALDDGHAAVSAEE